jgi:hypothetical protein
MSEAGVSIGVDDVAEVVPMTQVRTRRVPPAAWPLTFALALGLAACGGGPTADESTPPPTTASPSPTDTASPSPSPKPTTPPGDTSDDGVENPPPFPANAEPDTGEAAVGAVGTLRDIRLGAHEGFDRVVFEFTGPATPSWNVRYVDEATQDASGMPVDVDGDAILEVTLFSVSAPEEGEESYEGPDVVRVDATEQVKEVVYSSLFEGYLQAFIGVDDGEQPFRAYAMEDPARIVVEVRDDG